MSFNYALGPDGEILSDRGVYQRCIRYMQEHSRFTGYLSGDGKTFTTWKGQILGRAFLGSTIRLTRLSYIHGPTLRSVRVRDVWGQEWYGRGNPGIAITLRKVKGSRA